MRPHLPALHRDHPGFFTVVLGLVITHIGMGVDALLPDRHVSPIWTTMNSVVPEFWWWSVAHFGVAVLIVVGIYGAAETRRPGFQVFFLLRAGCLLSIVSFNAIGVSLISGALLNHLSFYPGLASVALSMASLAAFKEPRFNTFHSGPTPTPDGGRG
jgi:hypothetical protein